jgi:hypothetical protein
VDWPEAWQPVGRLACALSVLLYLVLEIPYPGNDPVQHLRTVGLPQPLRTNHCWPPVPTGTRSWTVNWQRLGYDKGHHLHNFRFLSPPLREHLYNTIIGNRGAHCSQTVASNCLKTGLNFKNFFSKFIFITSKKIIWQHEGDAPSIKTFVNIVRSTRGFTGTYRRTNRANGCWVFGTHFPGCWEIADSGLSGSDYFTSVDSSSDADLPTRNRLL